MGVWSGVWLHLLGRPVGATMCKQATFLARIAAGTQPALL